MNGTYITKISVLKALQEARDVLVPQIRGINMNSFWKTNNGLNKYDDDPIHNLIDVEFQRYRFAAELIVQRHSKASRVYDLGTFIPVLPIALTKLGFDVTVCERFSLYDQQLRDVVESAVEDYDIAVRDIDMLNDSLSFLNDADFVLLMAVVEHLNGSPRELLSSIFTNLRSGCHLIFEVPNIADLAKRIRLARGRSPLPPYPLYYQSAYPYSGHNREMTMKEVRFALEEAGFVLEELFCTDYSPPCSTKDRLIRVAKKLLPLSDHNETIFAVARKP